MGHIAIVHGRLQGPKLRLDKGGPAGQPRVFSAQAIYFSESPASLLSNALTRYISETRVRVQRVLLSEVHFCPGAERATPRVKMEKPRAYIAVHYNPTPN